MHLRAVSRWAESNDPIWMAHAVPGRHGRTQQAFRFATAATLREFDAAGFTGVGHLYRSVAAELEAGPRVWSVRGDDWRRFVRWLRPTDVNADELTDGGCEADDLPPSNARGDVVGISMFCVRGAAGFCRFVDGLHFVNMAETATRDLGDRWLAERTSALDRTAARILREVFGHPAAASEEWSAERVAYRWPPRLLPAAWLTDTVKALAARIWDANEFGAMPILADALQDAGCDRDDVLTHCRDAGESHNRGCWVLDAILGGES